jgi:hypothetical protein
MLPQKSFGSTADSLALGCLLIVVLQQAGEFTSQVWIATANRIQSGLSLRVWNID